MSLKVDTHYKGREGRLRRGREAAQARKLFPTLRIRARTESDDLVFQHIGPPRKRTLRAGSNPQGSLILAR